MGTICNMKLAKFAPPACVRLEKDAQSLVIDPGAMTPDQNILDGAKTVLITHEHFHHFEEDTASSLPPPTIRN